MEKTNSPLLKHIWNGFIFLSFAALTYLAWDAIIFDPRMSMKAIGLLYWCMGGCCFGLFFE